MSPKLKPLLLPQLVEERKLKESISESEMDLSSSTYSQSSTDAPSPVTPTFSTRGHLRYPSSASSVESSFHSSVMSDSPSSPSFVVVKPGKRSLPDVQEEPLEREDQDFDMLEDANELYECLCKLQCHVDGVDSKLLMLEIGDSNHCFHHDPSIVQSSVQLSSQRELEYDLADGFCSDGVLALSPRGKKRRANESTLNEIALRLGSKLPAFSRKWRLRKGSIAASIASDSQQETHASRAASSRSSSVSNSARRGLDNGFEPQLPATPTKSISEEMEADSTVTPIDIDKANRGSEEVAEEVPTATTPLLPPLMMDASANAKQILMQSPLQSPSVAEPNDPISGAVSPIDAVTTPQLTGLPSPPLSTKPSISSFHAANRPGHLVPSSEIPPLVIADPNDEWANKLGHANFNIHPEPYVPDFFDLEACRQLRANWDLARCNYTKHLVRTGEHYGVTSKTYKLSEEKWKAIDATWRQNNDLTIANTVENSSTAFATLKHTTLGDPTTVNIMTKIPSLNDPRSEGKFPQLGDEDIVGPMAQAAAQLQRSPSKKAKFLRFIAERFPAALSKP